MIATSGLPEVVLSAWHFRATAAGRSTILPDGCRDLIVQRRAAGPVRYFVSPLMDSSQLHDHEAGEQLWGLRLLPGTRIDEPRLHGALRRGEPDEAALRALIDACCVRPDRLAQALAALASHRLVRRAASDVGLSERSLERLLRRHTGRPPGWWRRLARVRGAARGLADGAGLAEIAVDHGFSDQAHMTREFRRWFGVTPGRFRASPGWRAMAQASGFDAAR